MAISAYLAKIGTGDPVAPARALADLLRRPRYSPSSASASPRFDPEELTHLNAKLLHHLPFEEARSHLPPSASAISTPAVWDAARANVEKVRGRRRCGSRW